MILIARSIGVGSRVIVRKGKGEVKCRLQKARSVDARSNVRRICRATYRNGTLVNSDFVCCESKFTGRAEENERRR